MYTQNVVYYYEMTETIRNIFWILLSVSILVIGLGLFYSAFKNFSAKVDKDRAAKAEREKDLQKRKEFEEVYSRRHSGGSER